MLHFLLTELKFHNLVYNLYNWHTVHGTLISGENASGQMETQGGGIQSFLHYLHELFMYRLNKQDTTCSLVSFRRDGSWIFKM